MVIISVSEFLQSVLECIPIDESKSSMRPFSSGRLLLKMQSCKRVKIYYRSLSVLSRILTPRLPSAQVRSTGPVECLRWRTFWMENIGPKERLEPEGARKMLTPTTQRLEGNLASPALASLSRCCERFKIMTHLLINFPSRFVNRSSIARTRILLEIVVETESPVK